MALAALVLLAVLAVVVVVLAVRQVRLGVQHQRTRLLVDALDARVGGVQRRLEEVPGIGTGRHEVALVLNPIKTHADRVRRELGGSRRRRASARCSCSRRRRTTPAPPWRGRPSTPVPGS